MLQYYIDAAGKCLRRLLSPRMACQRSDLTSARRQWTDANSPVKMLLVHRLVAAAAAAACESQLSGLQSNAFVRLTTWVASWAISTPPPLYLARPQWRLCLLLTLMYQDVCVTHSSTHACVIHSSDVCVLVTARCCIKCATSRRPVSHVCLFVRHICVLNRNG